jgi:hypothetical protein
MDRAREGLMQQKLLIPLIGLLLLLAGTVVVLLLRGRPTSPPIMLNEASENAANPYQGELECIDWVMQRHDMNANEVEPALASCRGSGGRETRSSEQ